MTGACTGYFSSLIHTKRVIPFGVGFSFLFLFLSVVSSRGLSSGVHYTDLSGSRNRELKKEQVKLHIYFINLLDPQIS